MLCLFCSRSRAHRNAAALFAKLHSNTVYMEMLSNKFLRGYHQAVEPGHDIERRRRCYTEGPRDKHLGQHEDTQADVSMRR
jgi:hypothetical protein